MGCQQPVLSIPIGIETLLNENGNNNNKKLKKKTKCLLKPIQNKQKQIFENFLDIFPNQLKFKTKMTINSHSRMWKKWINAHLLAFHVCIAPLLFFLIFNVICIT